MHRLGALTTLLLFMCLSAWAQDTANIVGTVMDSTGAVIPGVKITAANTEKGISRALATNAAGEYTAANLPIGNYTVTAEAPGFQKLIREGITLQVGQTLRVDLQMTVGQVTQEVTVTGNVVKVETEKATISDVITGNQIANLELNGRNFVALATLVPGAAPGDDLSASHVGMDANQSISFNGGRTQYNNWEIDGGGNSDDTSNSTFNTYPNLDTIAEFRISTSNYGADMGKHAGATIEVVTKAGTKKFHGDVFEFVRNDKFDANDWFANRQIAPEGGHAPKTPLKWNDYGYTLGGPFYIPGKYNTDKSKTFFFWSQNWRKYREGIVINDNVPSARMRQGDFSECHNPGYFGPTDPGSPNYNEVAASGCVLPVNPDDIDPVTGNRNPFPNDTVPIDPNAQALLGALIPRPNNGIVGYLSAPSLPTNWRQEQIRIDQNISDKTGLFVRYTQDVWDTQSIPPLWVSGNYDTGRSLTVERGKSAVIRLTHTFKPNLMNEFLMNYTVNPYKITGLAGASSVARSLNKPSTWTAGTLFAANGSNPLLPTLSICGGVPFCMTQDTGYYPFIAQIPQYTWKDNVTWSVGKHMLKFGFFLETLQMSSSNFVEPQGVYSFGAGGSVTTGNALADMFLGRIESYSEATAMVNGVPVGGNPMGHWRQQEFEPYFQDDWKVSRKLTLNLGVRYYFYVPYHDTTRPQTLDSVFIPSKYDPAVEALLDADGYLVTDPATGHIHDYRTFGNGLYLCGAGSVPKGCTTINRWSLAPRFGFAYDPWSTGKTVIRGGYGVYYEMFSGNETDALAGNPPILFTSNAYNIVGYQSIVAGPIGPTSFTNVPEKEKLPTVHQFSLGVQHEFPGNNLLSVSYAGSLGRHLARNRNLNQVPIGIGTVNVPALAGASPNCDAAGNCNVQEVLINNEAPTIFFAPYRGYSNIAMKEPSAVANYNSLQVNFRHAFGHGLTFQTAYTWAHAIDDSTSTYFQTGVNDYDLKRWRATSDLNRTQVLVMNYVYDLPFFKNTSSSVVKSVLGGWTVSGITSFFTGLPVDFGCGIDGMSSGIGEGVRCNSLGPLKITKASYIHPEFGPTPTWTDPSVIGQVRLDQLRADGQPGMFGYLGRNPLRGPGRNNWDLALLKNFQLPWFGTEHSTLQFRLETFNSFNHPQWRGVSVGCSGATTPGEPCTGPDNIGNGEISGAWAPRIMQLGLKFIF